MRQSSFWLFIFLSIFSAYGQENSISEFDLYGCWVLEKSENAKNIDKTIYKRCWAVSPKMRITSSAFSLLAYGKTQIQRWSPNVCPATYTDYGTWVFDEENNMVTMSYAQNLLKELKRNNPEEYKKFGSREKLQWKKFKVLSLSKNRMEIEEINTRNQSTEF